MTTSALTHGAIVVISVRGSLISIPDPDQIPWELKALLGRSAGVILDLRDVPRLDCSGIGFLASLYPLVHEMEGQLHLVNLGTRPRQMLEACGLLPILQSTSSEEDALTFVIEPGSPERYLERAELKLSRFAPSRHRFEL